MKEKESQKPNDVNQAVNVQINLFEYIKEGKIDNVIQLIESGANVEAKNIDGMTPLIFAARHGKLNVVQFLVETAEAKVDAIDNTGYNAFHYAVKNGHQELAELLTAKGANLEAKNNYGWTALHFAAQHSHQELAELLIARGANLEAKDNYGSTALHLAARNGHQELAELLIAKGANLEAKNIYGYNALHLAARNGHQELAELLIAKGADVWAKNNNGSTPLYYAAEHGHQELAELLNKNWRFLKEISQKSDQIMNFNPGEEPIEKKLSFFKIFQFVPKISLIRQLANQGYEIDKIKSKIIEIEKYLLNNAINISGIVKNPGSTILTFTIEDNQCNNYKEQKEYYLKTQQRTGNKKIGSYIENVKVITTPSSNTIDSNDAKPNNNSTESTEVSMFMPIEILNHIFRFFGDKSLSNIYYNPSNTTQIDTSNLNDQMSTAISGASSDTLEV